MDKCYGYELVLVSLWDIVNMCRACSARSVMLILYMCQISYNLLI